MKTFIYIALFAFMFVPATSQAALPDGCLPTYNYSPLNGQRCVDTPRVECATGDLFSYLTGQPCGVVEESDEEVNTPTQESVPTPVVPAPIINKGELSISASQNAIQVTLKGHEENTTNLNVVAPDGLKLFDQSNVCSYANSVNKVTCFTHKTFTLNSAEVGKAVPELSNGIDYQFKITVFGQEYIKTVTKNSSLSVY